MRFWHNKEMRNLTYLQASPNRQIILISTDNAEVGPLETNISIIIIVLDLSILNSNKDNRTTFVVAHFSDVWEPQIS